MSTNENLLGYLRTLVSQSRYAHLFPSHDMHTCFPVTIQGATRKMEQEREVMKAQIEAIQANTALTEQQKKTEEKRTMQEGLLKIAQAHLKLGIGGTGVGAEVDINIDVERYYKMLQDGATMEEITDEVLKEVEKQAKEAKPEKKEKDWERNLREADEEFKRNNPNYRDIKIY